MRTKTSKPETRKWSVTVLYQAGFRLESETYNVWATTKNSALRKGKISGPGGIVAMSARVAD